MPFLEAIARWLLTRPAATLGAAGEREAARHLRRKGYRILARNWRCEGGEVDLIARDGPWVVFVEVKTRRSGDRVMPEEQVHAHKQGRLRHAAQVFLSRFRGEPPQVRFDVMAVVWPESSQAPEVRHHPHAFE